MANDFHLVKDINQVPSQGVFANEDIVDINGTAYFAKADGATGVELWKTDGTPTGTHLVKDIASGQISSYPTELTNVNGVLYFRAFTDSNALVGQLWKSDGTAEGTVKVKDIDPGDLTSFNGMLVFKGYSATNPSGALWKSDGTAQGTVLVKRFALSDNVNSNLYNITDVEGTLYFFASDNGTGNWLWKSDGTESGTSKISRFSTPSNANPSFPASFTKIGDTLYFAKDTATRGVELWKTDGTSDGTVVVKDIKVGSAPYNSSYPSDLINFNGTLYFTAEDGVSGRTLWKSDGTALGTTRITTLGPAEHAANLREYDGGLIFTSFDFNQVRGPKLWKSDGTEAGTAVVKILGEKASSAGILTILSDQPRILTTTDEGVTIWSTDGTETGTTSVESSFPTAWSASGAFVSSGTGLLFFASNDKGRRTLFRLQDNASSIDQVAENVGAGTAGSRSTITFTISNAIAIENTVVFSANDGVHGTELWSSDGTEQGTRLVKELTAGPIASRIFNLVELDGAVYFMAIANRDVTLWKTDGTEGGTSLVKSFSGIVFEAEFRLVSAGNQLYFYTRSRPGVGAPTVQLWKSDGTTSGTSVVKEFVNPGGGNWEPQEFTSMNGTLFFTLDDPNIPSSRELWKSDGTESGTVKVKDIYAGQLGAFPQNLTVANGILYFFAGEPVHGFALWKSDGTEAGTVFVSNSMSTQGSEFIQGMAAVGDKVFFGMNSTQSLWVSDGTPEGTKRLKTPTPTIEGSRVLGQIQAVDNTLFFSMSDRATGVELWKSDGTEPGTVLVKDIRRGVNNSAPFGFTRIGDQIYFSADDGVRGRELWKSDGTSNGTTLVQDFSNGPTGDAPTDIVLAGENLFVFASSPAYGIEPWVYTRGPNIAPTDILTSPLSATENVPVGTALGELSTVDSNLLDSHTYSLISGAGDTDNALFQVIGNRLVTNAKLDFEIKSALSVLIRSQDPQGLFVDRQLSIQVTDVVLSGDINLDDMVDFRDFGVLKDHFGSVDATLAEGDLNGDGKIDLKDFKLLRSNFGRRL